MRVEEVVAVPRAGVAHRLAPLRVKQVGVSDDELAGYNLKAV